MRRNEDLHRTWLETEDAAGPRGAMLRKGRVRLVMHSFELRPGGIETYPLRAVRCGVSDTFFSAPGFVLEAGKRVHGCVFYENDTFVFRPTA